MELARSPNYGKSSQWSDWISESRSQLYARFQSHQISKFEMVAGLLSTVLLLRLHSFALPVFSSDFHLGLFTHALLLLGRASYENMLASTLCFDRSGYMKVLKVLKDIDLSRITSPEFSLVLMGIFHFETLAFHASKIRMNGVANNPVFGFFGMGKFLEKQFVNANGKEHYPSTIAPAYNGGEWAVITNSLPLTSPAEP